MGVGICACVCMENGSEFLNTDLTLIKITAAPSKRYLITLSYKPTVNLCQLNT